MTFFDGFKAFNFEEGVPYFSVTKNGVTFNKAVVMKLGYPEYVVLLINESEKKIALKKCSKETPNSTVFYKENSKKILSIRWNMKDLLNTIQDMMGWKLSQDSYRIDGTLIKEEEAMLFDLTTAKCLTDQ
jgi:hypothetical protein